MLYRPLDRWIEWIDKNVDPEAPLSPPDLEANVAAAMVCGLTWRAPWHPGMATWVDRALRASEQVADTELRFMVRATVMEYHAQIGNIAEMYELAVEFKPLTLSPQAQPLAQLAFMVRAVELRDWVEGSWEETMGLLHKAIDLATELNSLFHQGVMFDHAAIVALEMNDLELAKRFLKQTSKLDFANKRSIESLHFCLWAVYHMSKNSLSEAYRTVQKGLRSAYGTGACMPQAYGRIILACVLRKMGKGEDAAAELDTVETMVRALGITHALYLVRLTQAILKFDRGDVGDGRRILSEAFSMGHAKGYEVTLYFWWQREDMARLAAEALAGDIEVGYAHELIRRHGLDAPKGHESMPVWPWRLRIYTFGGLRLVVNGEPLKFSRKMQKRPLALLRALIALGGEGVRQETVEDLLWPEAEGDAARISLKTTLGRLRHLLGSEKTIELQDGKLTLAGSRVWLDTKSLEKLSRDIVRANRVGRGKGPDEAIKLGHGLLDLYEGDFLAGEEEPWISQCRKVQRKRFVAAIEATCTVLLETGKSREAGEVLREAIQKGVPREEFSSSLPA